MASPVNPPRGTRDFLPAEKRVRERLTRVIREAYSAHGFDEIETPVMEDAARLHSGLGGDNEKLAFGILRRGLTPEDVQAAESPQALTDLGLRFDLTVPLARFYASHQGELPSVVKTIQIGSSFRAERPQKGRYRQFTQCDIDVLGEPGLIAELELLAATADTLTRLGIPDAFIRVNDRRILIDILTEATVAPADHDRALITIDKLDKLGTDGVRAELDAAGLPGERILTGLGAAASRFAGAEDPGEAYRDVAALLSTNVGIRLEFDPSLVRGMGYYTGPIFEIAHPELGYSIGGGGRYDGMIGRFLGREVPATGMSLGFDRLVDIAQLDDASEPESLALVLDRDVDPTHALAVKRTLVAGGAHVRIVRRAKNLQNQLQQLQTAGVGRWAAVHPDSEVESLDFRDLAK